MFQTTNQLLNLPMILIKSQSFRWWNAMKYQFLPATFTHFTMAPEAVIGDTLHEAAFNLAVGIPALHRMPWHGCTEKVEMMYTRWCPSSLAKLVNNLAPRTMVYGRYIYIYLVNGIVHQQTSLGGHHLVAPPPSYKVPSSVCHQDGSSITYFFSIWGLL